MAQLDLYARVQRILLSGVIGRVFESDGVAQWMLPQPIPTVHGFDNFGPWSLILRARSVDAWR